MKFVKPTNDQWDFIPTPLAAQENVKKVGIGIVDQLVSFDYVRTADETKSLLDEKVDGDANGDGAAALRCAAAGPRGGRL